MGISVIVSTKLTIDDYVNLRKLCEERGCSTYRIVKEAITEHLLSQSDKESLPPLEKEEKTQDLGEVEAQPTMEAGEVEARVKRILKGEVE